MEGIESQQNLEFICEQCKRTFSKKSKLSRHVRESHLNIKNFTCTQCNKTFKRNSHLKRHMISHSAEPKPFKCNQCTMQFACKHHLERHIKTLHAEDFPFQCEICPLRFPKRACLYKHLTFIHNLKKPYKCGECDKDFFKNGQLIRHLKRVHPNSFNAQQQLMEAQEYQIQQRIQANLALKNDKKDGKLSADPSKYSGYMKNQSNPTATISTFNNDNAYYSESFQKNQQNATCYYYSLENQIQNLNSLHGSQQQQQQQPQSSATSVISFSSSSYPSSTSPANFYDQSQYYKKMTEKYGFDEIQGDEYDGEDEDDDDDDDDDEDESEDEVYNLIYKQGELKNNKKIQQEDDDENSFYLISAAANAASLRVPPLQKEKKIKKESKNAPIGSRKSNKSSGNRKYSTKNEEIYMLDNHMNTFEEQMLPVQKRKLSEEIFCHLGLIGNSSGQNNFNNLNSYFLAAEDEITNANQQLQLQQQQTIEGGSGLENNFMNYSSAYLPQSFGLAPAVATVAQNAVCSASQENNSNEKQQLQQQQQCTETLINNGSSSNSNNVAVQQQFNLNNIQNNIYYQQKHEQEQQCAASQQFGSSNAWPVCQSGSAAIQGSTTTQKVCYVPGCSTSSMQPTQKQYQQQQQQSQNSYTQTSQQQQLTSSVSAMTNAAAAAVFSNPQQQQSPHSLGIQNNNNFSHQSSSQSEPFSVKNEDNGNNTLLPIIYPVETFFNTAHFSQEEAVYPSQSSQQNEVNIDFLNLMDYNNSQNHNSSTNYHQMLNSDFLQMNSILMMDYSSKLQTSQYQIPQIVLPLSQNGLHSSQHIGINYASIAKTM
ncbi:hypothetical protein ABPG72_008230 [Tetrahymena utriculariae]